MKIFLMHLNMSLDEILWLVLKWLLHLNEHLFHEIIVIAQRHWITVALHWICMFKLIQGGCSFCKKGLKGRPENLESPSEVINKYIRTLILLNNQKKIKTSISQGSMAQNPDQRKLWFNVSLTSLEGSAFELSFEDPY